LGWGPREGAGKERPGPTATYSVPANGCLKAAHWGAHVKRIHGLGAAVKSGPTKKKTKRRQNGPTGQNLIVEEKRPAGSHPFWRKKKWWDFVQDEPAELHSIKTGAKKAN